MKTSLTFFSLLFISLVFFAASCDKNGDADPDTFLVSVSDTLFDEGSRIVYNTSNTEFTLTFTPASLAKASPDAVSGDFWVAETELCYKLWKEIRDWAVNNGYQLPEGQPGSDVSFPADHPVTRVCWYDAVVWCNALTEFYNRHNGERPDYSYAYTVGGSPIRNADIKNTEFEEMDVDASATGFRIPTNHEWYRAAAYGGVPDYAASGASASVDDEAATSQVCWYRKNSDMHSHPVAGKLPNHLGVYDMSGNVSEIVFDLLDMYDGKSNIRGGAWNSNPGEVSVTASHPTEEHTSSYAVGFRIVRSSDHELSAK